eukprot:GFYU01003333.1.p1 GENE.GFYU01003333.1~~GFYU01003333.1.p1  ORF type:complete len:436 (+),score=121.38 GFYU01003333.1:364-1671(+)
MADTTTEKRRNSSLDELLLGSSDALKRQSTVQSAVFNLVSTIVGGGVLSLPFAFHSAGVIVGPIMLVIIALASDFSVYILVSCSRRSGGRTYEEVADLAFGPAAKMVTVLLLFLLTYLCCVAYIVLMGDLVTPIFSYLLKEDLGDSGRQIVMGVCTLCVLPFCFLNSMNSLRFTSQLCVLSILFLGVAVGYRCVETNQLTPALLDDVKYWPNSWHEIVYAIPVCSVAYLCHFNMLPIHCELKKPTRRRIKRVIHTTMGMCTALYIIIGMFGYLYAYEATKGNILNNFANDDPIITVGRIGLSFTVIFSFPLLALPCRDALERLLSLVAHSDTALGHCCVRLFHQDQPSQTERVIETLLVVLSSLLLATAIPGVVVIWGIMGSTVSVVIAYFLPGIFYLKIRQNIPFNRRKFLAWVLVLVSPVLAILGTWEAIDNI